MMVRDGLRVGFAVDNRQRPLHSRPMTPLDPDAVRSLDEQVTRAQSAAPRVRSPAPVRFTLADLVSAVPDLLLAATFLAAWVDPSTRGVPTVRRLVMIVLLEFFIVHSSGFMGAIAVGDRDRGKTIAMTLGLGAFYTLFLAAFSAGFKDWWLLGSFWLLMANRLLGLVLGQSPDEKRQSFIMGSWAVSVAAYLLAVSVGAASEPPALGITASVIRAQGFTMGGLWTEQPQTALAAGAIYFAIMGAWELLIPTVVFRRERARDAGDRAMIITA